MLPAMSDLLASLFIPGFFPEPPTDVHEAAMDGSGIEVQDVETYLNKPKNQAFLAASGTSSTKAKHSVTGGGYSAPQPVQLGGPKTSHHVTTLHHLCQSQGLVPEFEIGAQPEGGFGGMLRVGDATVTSYEGWSTKKEAKEALAEKGIPLVKGMKITGTGSAFGGESKNWIGLLMGTRGFLSQNLGSEGHHTGKADFLIEYHCVPGSETGGVGANYIEYAIGLLFACTCTIPSHDIEFGSSTTPFSTKKAARNNAAKEAVQFLISQDLTNPDGTVKARKKASTPGQNVKMKGKSLAVKMDASFAQKVSGTL